ncbi:MAG: transposase [Candidatus Eisenbacteria sp.]|nr:transposase [Candidatus Eisenbacteria bacterium]
MGVLWEVGPGGVILFPDEVDIDFMPRTDYVWCPRGVPAEIETLGRKERRYLAGALNTDTGHFLFVVGCTGRGELVIVVLKGVGVSYRWVRRLHRLVDNYSIHGSLSPRNALAALQDRIVLHFLPPYSPRCDPEELVWRESQIDVTINHRFHSMGQLANAAARFLEVKGCIWQQCPLPPTVTQHGSVVSDEQETVWMDSSGSPKRKVYLS